MAGALGLGYPPAGPRLVLLSPSLLESGGWQGGGMKNKQRLTPTIPRAGCRVHAAHVREVFSGLKEEALDHMG